MLSRKGVTIAPAISVVIATKNRPAMVRELLFTLSQQSLPRSEFEVLVIDNGSEPPAVQTTEREVARILHWKCLSEPKPGAAAARNAGIQAASAEFILFLDDDIVADSSLVAEHLNWQRAHPDTIVLGKVRFPWDGTESPLCWALARHPELLQSFGFEDSTNVPFQHFYTCNVSLPRALVAREKFDEDFTGSGFEDTELAYRLARGGYRMLFNLRASALHNVAPDFSKFKKKTYRNGCWLQLLLQKHPEVAGILLPASEPAYKNALDFIAAPFEPLFNRAHWLAKRSLLPLLGVLCWRRLQGEFRRGYRDASSHSRLPGQCS